MGISSGFFSIGTDRGDGAPQIHFLLLKESAIDQGEQILGLQFRFLPLFGRIGARSGWRRRILAAIFGFTMGPLLRCAGLHALGRG
jgi:hypothetical protein